MNAPQQPERPRRAFLEPPPRQPFYKTREGRFLAFFSLLFVLCCIQLFLQYRKAQQKVALAEAERAKVAAEQVHEVSRAEQLAKKRVELGTIFEGAFADTANGDPFVETSGYAKLIEQLAVMTPEATAARATKLADYALAIGEPDLQRGEFLRVQGVIGGISAVKLDNPVNDITDVWRGTVALAGGDEPFVFDFIGTPPSDFEVRKTSVEVAGLMYRTVSYVSKTREKKTAPYLLVRSIRRLEVQNTAGDSTTTWAIVIGMAVIAAYLMVRSFLRGGRRSTYTPPRLRGTLTERRRAGSGQEL